MLRPIEISPFEISYLASSARILVAITAGFSGLGRIEQLEQVQRDAERQAPDGLAAVEYGRKLRRASRRSLALPFVVAAELRIAQRAQRHVEDLRDLRQLRLERRVGRDDSYEWRDDNPAGGRLHRRERADHIDRRRKDADLLVRLTQRRVEESRIDWINAS